MSQIVKHNIAWIAVLRIVACFLVVLAHCCDPFVAGSSAAGFNAGALLGTITRPSVPLFIMLSGALMLPTSLSVGDFYRRRLRKIIRPFIFWSIVSPWMFYLFTSLVQTQNPGILAENHTLLATIKASYMWIVNFSYSTIPYWYIYMMLGVYLVIPIISAWVREAEKKELDMVLGIWLFSTLVPYIQIVAPLIGYAGNYGSVGIYGECSWNLFTTFHYVSGFVGYAIFAHYLMKYPLKWTLCQSVVRSILIWAVGYAITLAGFHFTRANFPDDYNMLEIIWAFNSLNVVMMTLPFFIVAQKINFRESTWISKLSESTFGIYLIHFVIVHIVFEVVFANIIIAPVAQILIIAVVSFALTAAISMLLRRIPLFRKLT